MGVMIFELILPSPHRARTVYQLILYQISQSIYIFINIYLNPLIYIHPNHHISLVVMSAIFLALKTTQYKFGGHPLRKFFNSIFRYFHKDFELYSGAGSNFFQLVYIFVISQRL